MNEIQEAALHSDEEEQLENQKRAIVNYANIFELFAGSISGFIWG